MREVDVVRARIQVERTKQACSTHLDIDGDAAGATTRARIVLHSTNELVTDVRHVHGHGGSCLVNALLFCQQPSTLELLISPGLSSFKEIYKSLL